MCGIFGLINKKKRHFDYSTFCTLGIHNDIRGGDSCGVFIDGNVEYGVKSNKFFEDFFLDSKLIGSTVECEIALGHCRKASVGIIDISTAQPVCIEKDGKIEFVVIHNGTIHNYKDLAAKYIPNIDIQGMTDSQVMTRIFYYTGYDVLSEYMGAAVFVIVDYRTEQPTVLFWQGASLTSKYGKVEEERPLYFAIKEDSLVFSSLATFFPALLRDWDIYTLEPNWLFTFEDSQLKSVQMFPRDGAGQFNPTNTYVSTYKGYNSGYDKIICRFSDLRFRINDGDFANGLCMVGMFGTLNVYNAKGMWFWEGVLLKNKEAYNLLHKLCENLGILPNELYEYYKEVVLYLSAFPYIKTAGGVEYVNSPLTTETFTGSLVIPFSNITYIINNGIVGKCITSSFDDNYQHTLRNMPETINLDHEIFKSLGIDGSL